MCCQPPISQAAFRKCVGLGALLHEVSYGLHVPGSGFLGKTGLADVRRGRGWGAGMLFSLKYGLGGRGCTHPHCLIFV